MVEVPARRQSEVALLEARRPDWGNIAFSLSLSWSALEDSSQRVATAKRDLKKRAQRSRDGNSGEGQNLNTQDKGQSEKS